MRAALGDQGWLAVQARCWGLGERLGQRERTAASPLSRPRNLSWRKTTPP